MTVKTYSSNTTKASERGYNARKGGAGLSANPFVRGSAGDNYLVDQWASGWHKADKDLAAKAKKSEKHAKQREKWGRL